VYSIPTGGITSSLNPLQLANDSKYGNYLLFNTGSQYLLSDSSFNDSNIFLNTYVNSLYSALTVNAWVKPSQNTNPDISSSFCLFALDDVEMNGLRETPPENTGILSDERYGLYLWCPGFDGKLQLFSASNYDTGTTQYLINESSDALKFNEWQMITLVIQGSCVYVYVDGTLAISTGTLPNQAYIIPQKYKLLINPGPIGWTGDASYSIVDSLGGITTNNNTIGLLDYKIYKTAWPQEKIQFISQFPPNTNKSYAYSLTNNLGLFGHEVSIDNNLYVGGNIYGFNGATFYGKNNFYGPTKFYESVEFDASNILAFDASLVNTLSINTPIDHGTTYIENPASLTIWNQSKDPDQNASIHTNCAEVDLSGIPSF